MALFKKLKKDKAEEAKKETAKKADEGKGPSLKNVKVPVATETTEEKAATEATSSPSAKKATVKTAPKSAEKATAKPAVKSTAKPATKPTAKAAPKPAAKPAPVTGVSSSARPFFVSTEEDIRLAFDAAIAEAEQEILHNGAKAIGKYEFELAVDGFHFYLIANNGQILFDSPSFTTLIGAINGIKTFKKAVAGGKFDIHVDKYNRYRFVLERKYYGENYTTREQCQKCVESVRNFASNAKIVRYTPTKSAIAAFEMAKACKRSPDDVNWRAIEQAEAQAQKMGKFEIVHEDDSHYYFCLLANNGQILYASRFYANETACRRGIDSFKRAAYVGNFFVDRDKFGNYRYVLKNIGSAPAFIGESYDNKPQCEKIIESVKNFIVTASIELDD